VDLVKHDTSVRFVNLGIFFCDGVVRLIGDSFSSCWPDPVLGRLFRVELLALFRICCRLIHFSASAISSVTTLAALRYFIGHDSGC
jgi:hypothetical protein